MLNNIKINSFYMLLIFSFSINTVKAQEWLEVPENERSILLQEIKSNNMGDGCFDLTYTIYNYSIHSSSIETVKGMQCKVADNTIINIYGEYLIYTNDSLKIHVDSLNKKIFLGYNHFADNKENIEFYSNLFLKNDVIYQPKESNKDRVYKIKSVENNGIDFYMLNLNDDYLLKSVEIHYKEITDYRYNQEPENNKPIIVIEYDQTKGRILEKMLHSEYFIQNKDSVLPSSKYSDYEISDSRILLYQ